MDSDVIFRLKTLEDRVQQLESEKDDLIKCVNYITESLEHILADVQRLDRTVDRL